jgi:N-acetylneuraminic acid mutarotase
MEIYEFNFKDERLYRSSLKLASPRSSFSCASRDG